MKRRLPLILLLLLWALPVLAGPEQAAALASRDLRTVAREDRKNQLYLWYQKKDPDKFYVALKLRLNELSNVPEMVDAVQVAPGLFRVDIADLDLDRRRLDKAADVEFHFHDKAKVKVRAPARKGKAKAKAKGMRMMAPAMMKGRAPAQAVKEVSIPAYVWLDPRDIDFLRKQTRSEAPILNAEWFFVRTGRQLNLQNREDGFGQYDLLGIANRADYFELIGLDEKRAIRAKREIRAALEAGEGKYSSRLAANGRQIGKLDTLQGMAWFTLDAQFPTGKGIATTNLRRGEFDHAAEEWIGHRRNGLRLGGLFDKDGGKQANAPEFVGQNDSPLNRSRDKKIHQGRCWECHTDVIRDIGQGGVDWVRWTFSAPGKKGKAPKLGSADRRVHKEQVRQYLSDLASAIDESRKAHARAIQLATVTRITPKGLDMKAAASAEANAYHAYATDPVTLASFAEELGATPKQLADALHARSATVFGLDTDLAPLIRDPPGTVSRLVVEDKYRRVQYYLRGLDPP